MKQVVRLGVFSVAMTAIGIGMVIMGIWKGPILLVIPGFVIFLSALIPRNKLLKIAEESRTRFEEARRSWQDQFRTPTWILTAIGPRLSDDELVILSSLLKDTETMFGPYTPKEVKAACKVADSARLSGVDGLVGLCGGPWIREYTNDDGNSEWCLTDRLMKEVFDWAESEYPFVFESEEYGRPGDPDIKVRAVAA